jgi:hypothetical protein
MTEPTPEALFASNQWAANVGTERDLALAFDAFHASQAYGKVHTDGSRSGGQPIPKSDAGEPCDPSPGGLERERNRPPAPASGMRSASGIPELNAEIMWLREALGKAIDFLETAPLESGFCCCGDLMESHNMGSGHSPVDELSYYANRIAIDLRQALKDQP